MPEALVKANPLDDGLLTPYLFLIAALKNKSCKADNGSFVEYPIQVVPASVAKISNLCSPVRTLTFVRTRVIFLTPRASKMSNRKGKKIFKSTMLCLTERAKRYSSQRCCVRQDRSRHT